MAKKQHVTRRPDGKWQVKGEGNSKATHVADTQEECIKLAKKIAANQDSSLVVHGRTGKIRKSK